MRSDADSAIPSAPCPDAFELIAVIETEFRDALLDRGEGQETHQHPTTARSPSVDSSHRGALRAHRAVARPQQPTCQRDSPTARAHRVIPGRALRQPSVLQVLAQIAAACRRAVPIPCSARPYARRSVRPPATVGRHAPAPIDPRSTIPVRASKFLHWRCQKPTEFDCWQAISRTRCGGFFSVVHQDIHAGSPNCRRVIVVIVFAPVRGTEVQFHAPSHEPCHRFRASHHGSLGHARESRLHDR